MEKIDACMYTEKKDMEKIEYSTAELEMVDEIRNVLHTAIKTVYPKYYPQEVVDFFCRHHSKEHVSEGIASGNMSVLRSGNIIVGTGCYSENHITGVYVLPACQNRGYGSRILDRLESEIAKNYDVAVLDASLPAVCMNTGVIARRGTGFWSWNTA